MKREEKRREYEAEIKRIDEEVRRNTDIHMDADDLLVKIARDCGFGEVSDWFTKLDKWYE